MLRRASGAGSGGAAQPGRHRVRAAVHAGGTRAEYLAHADVVGDDAARDTRGAAHQRAARASHLRMVEVQRDRVDARARQQVQLVGQRVDVESVGAAVYVPRQAVAAGGLERGSPDGDRNAKPLAVEDEDELARRDRDPVRRGGGVAHAHRPLEVDEGVEGLRLQCERRFRQHAAARGLAPPGARAARTQLCHQRLGRLVGEARPCVGRKGGSGAVALRAV
mmetsp:Transcript_14028/g.42055  ORF Transcript_14028/g.42055 Transcript_14028/m.42055 type:complete len:221 (+) Transcript_14028:1-663(+)